MDGQKVLRRAQTDEQKGQRQAKILEVAKEKFGTSDFDQVTLSAIARDAGVVKGTLYLYYQSKEALALAVLVQELRDWSRDLIKSLSEDKPKLENLALNIARLSVERVLIRKLFTILNTILEKNISTEIHVNFKRSLLELMQSLKVAIEVKFPSIKGGVQNFLVNLWVVIIGTFSLGAKTENTGLLTEHPEIEPLFVDHEKYLAGVVLQLLS